MQVRGKVNANVVPGYYIHVYVAAEGSSVCFR